MRRCFSFYVLGILLALALNRLAGSLNISSLQIGLNFHPFPTILDAISMLACETSCGVPQPHPEQLDWLVGSDFHDKATCRSSSKALGFFISWEAKNIAVHRVHIIRAAWGPVNVAGPRASAVNYCSCQPFEINCSHREGHHPLTPFG